MRWRVFGYGALAGLVALAACSSSDIKEYRTKANETCASAAKRMEKGPEPSSPAEIAEAAKKEIAAREVAIASLEELMVPMNIEGAHAVVDDLKARQERTRELEKAAKKEDRAKLRELEHHDSEESEVEAVRATELGLHDCAEL